MQFIVLQLVLALVLAPGAQANYFKAAEKPASDIKALCAGERVALRTVDELKQLAQLAPDSACAPHVRQALPKLADLIERAKGDECSHRSIDGFVAFYRQYVDSSSDAETRGRSAALPKSLRRFVIAYGMQLSQLCKTNLIENLKVLKRTWNRHLSDEDLTRIESLADERSPAAAILGDIAGSNGVFLPGDLVTFLKPNGDEEVHASEPEKVYLQTATGPFVRRMQALCKHRFLPAYKPLVTPIVRLANLGFDFKSVPLKCELECASAARKLAHWSRIIFMCETLAMINVVEDEADKKHTEGTSTSLVRIVTKEEAAAIEAHAPTHQAADEAAKGLVLSESEASMYEPRQLVDLDSVVYDKEDARLRKALKAFKADRAERDIIRKRLTRNSLALIKAQIKKGNYGLIISAGFKSVLRKLGTGKGGESYRPDVELVKFMDEALDGKSAVGRTEGAVAGELGGMSYSTWIGAGILLVGFIILLAFAALGHLHLG